VLNRGDYIRNVAPAVRLHRLAPGLGEYTTGLNFIDDVANLIFVAAYGVAMQGFHRRTSRRLFGAGCTLCL
jgi:hypothetical protein